MELTSLKGNIIGVISKQYQTDNFDGKKVKDLITNKVHESLKMVKLDETYLEEHFENLSNRNKNKVILATKLHDKTIILINFSKGLVKKDIEYFKALFKKISRYNKKIILIDNNLDLFLNLVVRIYVIDNDEIKYETLNLYDKTLKLYADLPPIVNFTYKCFDEGVRLDYYSELDELLKAIYRIKS